MAVFKVTFVWRWKFNGCSTSLYQNGGTYDTVRELAKDLGQEILSAMGAGTELPYIRVSDESVRGDAIVYDVGYINPSKSLGTVPGQNSVSAASSSSPNDPISCLMVNLTSADRAHGRFFMRWIPDVTSDTGVFAPSQAVENQLQKVFKKLKDDKWGFMAKQPGAPRFKIQAIGAAGTGTDRLTVLANGHPFTNGKKVKIAGVKGQNANLVNRTWTISGAEIGSFKLVNSVSAATGGFTYVEGGEVWDDERQFRQIFEASYRSDIKGRRPGRPFGSLRGRRSVRRK